MTKKTYSFGALDKDEDWKTIRMLDTKEDNLLYDYQKKAMTDVFKMLGTNLCSEVTLPYTSTPQITTKAPDPSTLSAKTPSYTMTVKDMQDMMKMLNTKVAPSIPSSRSYTYADYDSYFKPSPQVGKYESQVEVVMDNGSLETISRAELIKYIGERKIIQENEVVRKVYERYQVAVKLVGSDDNGDTGV